MKLRWLGSIGLAAALALTACGGGGGEAEAPTELEVSAPADNTLAFQPTSLQAAADTDVTVTFDNQASIPHNFVVVRQGVEDQVAQAAASAETPGEVEENEEQGILAGGSLVDGGDDEDVEFNLPAGTYSYICTYPGHTAQMKGTLTVQ